LKNKEVEKEIEDIEVKGEVFEGLFFFIIQNPHHLKELKIVLEEDFEDFI